MYVLLKIARLSELQKQYSEAVYAVKEQKELISQLEGDLLSVNALPSVFRGQGEVSMENVKQIAKQYRLNCEN